MLTTEATKIYGETFNRFLKKKEQDDEEEKDLIEIRDVLIANSKAELVYLVETLVIYTNFGCSESFMELINQTKWLTYKVEKEPNKVIELYKKWEDILKTTECTNDLEVAEMTVIVERVYDWLGGLK